MAGHWVKCYELRTCYFLHTTTYVGHHKPVLLAKVVENEVIHYVLQRASLNGHFTASLYSFIRYIHTWSVTIGGATKGTATVDHQKLLVVSAG